MATAPSENPREWRYTWETLAHIPILRLYLFDLQSNPSSRCRSLRTSLRLEECVLLVTWIEDSGDVALMVPVPRVLIDPAFPVEAIAKPDYIEIKLTLVVPVDHPLVADLQDVGPDQLLPLDLGLDIKNLSVGSVHFYCKSCSTRLTKQPVSRFVEMPSVNWQDVADNWFGACCCSFGGISEKLVSEYSSACHIVSGTCLVDAASLIICKDDLEGCKFQHCADSCLEFDSGDESDDHRGFSEGACEIYLSHSYVDENNRNHLSHPLLSLADCRDGNDAAVSLSLEIPNVDPHRLNGFVKPDVNVDLVNNWNTSSDSLACDVPSVEHCHCSSGNIHYAPDNHLKISTINSILQKSQTGPHNGYLGGGFVIRSSNHSKDVNWVEFFCRSCSSLLGTFPSLKSKNVPLDSGVRLFKCYVSTSIPSCGPHDIFRKHTLQRVFANLLHESATDELSFCTVVTDLRTKSPVLQIILLNSKAWFATGCCYQNVTIESFPEIVLHPVVKVLFSDNGGIAGLDTGVMKHWSTMNEELYMLTDQIKKLTEILNAAVNRLPRSCSCLQGMSLSALDR